MARGDDIQERSIGFAVRVLKVCNQLPRTLAGRHVAGQLVRSGTAPAPHYAEARGAESRADFIHKLGVCLKELNETQVWLQIIIRSDMLPEDKLVPLISECQELSRIINASRQTARSTKR